MEEATGVFDSVKRAAIERINNPVSGTFCLAWVACNWKFIVVLFAEMGVSQTFNYVDTHLYDSPLAKAYHWVIAPGALTVIFLSVVPALGLLVFTYNGLLVEWRRRIKHSIERESVLTAKQAAGIWQARVAERERHALEIERLHKLLAAAGVEVPPPPDAAPKAVRVEVQAKPGRSPEIYVKKEGKYEKVYSAPAPRLQLDELSELLMSELILQGGLMPEEELFRGLENRIQRPHFDAAVEKLLDLQLATYIGTFDKDGGRMFSVTDEGFRRHAQ